MRKIVKPAHEDPENSVDVFDADRRNEFDGLYCVAAAILPSQVEQAWDQYSEYRAEELAGRGADYSFRDPGGRSALRSGPRRFPCPTCGREGVLSQADVNLGYQCGRCADAAEGIGF